MQKEHIRFSIFRINTIQKINVKREKRSKSFQVVGWFYNFSQDCTFLLIHMIIFSTVEQSLEKKIEISKLDTTNTKVVSKFKADSCESCFK